MPENKRLTINYRVLRTVCWGNNNQIKKGLLLSLSVKNFFYRWTFGKVTSKNVHGCLVHFVRLVAKRRRKCTRQPPELLVTFVNDPTVWIFSWLIGTYSIQENGYAHAGLRKGEKFDKMTRRPVTGRQTDMWLQITIAEQNRILLLFWLFNDYSLYRHVTNLSSMLHINAV